MEDNWQARIDMKERYEHHFMGVKCIVCKCFEQDLAVQNNYFNSLEMCLVENEEAEIYLGKVQE